MRVQQHDDERAHGEQDEVLLAPQQVGQVRTDHIADVGADDHHGQVATGTQHAQAALVLEEGRQPRSNGVVAAQCASGQQGRTHGGPEHAWGKDFIELRRRLGVFHRLGLAVYLGVLDQAADEDHEDRRYQAQQEQRAPGLLCRKPGEQQRIEDGGKAPAKGPAGLHHAHRLATVLGADHLADQDRAGGPLTAKAEAHQGTGDQQLFVVLGEPAEEGEEGKPQHRQLQGAHAANAVGENAGHPATHGRGDQGAGVDQPGFGGGDAPQHDQRRNDEAEHLRVHAVQAVADLAAPERPALL